MTQRWRRESVDFLTGWGSWGLVLAFRVNNLGIVGVKLGQFFDAMRHLEIMRAKVICIAMFNCDAL